MARKRNPTDLNTAEAFRLPDAARAYSIGESTLREAIRDGRLEASKLGNSPRSPVIVTRRAMERLIAESRVAPDRAAA